MIANIVPLDEWQAARLGCITSSECAVLFVEPKAKAAKEAGELSEGCKTYLREKVTELVTGTVRVFDSYATEWGKQMEPRAVELLRAAYPELDYHGDENKWFCKFIGFSGGSPDFSCKALNLIGEVKCPENPANHLDHLLLNTGQDLKEWNKEYWYQVQMNGLVVSKFWGVDFSAMKLIFASYGDLFPENLRLKIIEIEPDLEFAEILLVKLEKAFQYMRSIRDTLKL